MIVDSKSYKKNKIEIDLNGPEGNIFVLMGYVKGFSKQLGLNSAKIINEMISSDYDHGITVFDKYFGDYVILIK